MKVSARQSGVEGRGPGAGYSGPARLCSRPSALGPRPSAAFTMVEIAICLAIIGIALIAIIGVLPIGINVQKDNRQETVIGQDAAVFLENIRSGARGMDDLTNYVFAITNFWTSYNANQIRIGGGVNGYTYYISSLTTPPNYPIVGSRLTNGANIIGLMSMPEYTCYDPTYPYHNGAPIPSLIYGGISNHVVAYVHSISGPAVEKPPQNNDIIRSDSFSYKILCANLPMAADTPPPWRRQRYQAGAEVSFLWNGQITYWKAMAPVVSLDPGPTQSPLWVQEYPYSAQLAANLHELRLTFLWPLLPNGFTGNGRHTFATTVAGQMVTNVVDPAITPPQLLYFFQPQSFTNVP